MGFDHRYAPTVQAVCSILCSLVIYPILNNVEDGIINVVFVGVNVLIIPKAGSCRNHRFLHDPALGIFTS